MGTNYARQEARAVRGQLRPLQDDTASLGQVNGEGAEQEMDGQEAYEES